MEDYTTLYLVWGVILLIIISAFGWGFITRKKDLKHLIPFKTDGSNQDILMLEIIRIAICGFLAIGPFFAFDNLTLIEALLSLFFPITLWVMLSYLLEKIGI